MSPELEKQTTKYMLLKLGHTALTKDELTSLISDNTVTGDYEYSGHRIYKTYMNKTGIMVGKNDWGSKEVGSWYIDENGYLSVEWQGYWEDWTGVAFKIKDQIKFYDINTGEWRTTFNKIEKGKKSLNISFK